MHDGITLEQYGLPTAVICTEPFRMTSRAITELQGLKDYPFGLVEHPIGSLTNELLNERAEKASYIVENILLHGETERDNKIASISESVQQVIAEYQPGLEIDGVRLEILNINKEQVKLKLIFQDTSCHDCVLKKDMLEPMLEKSIENISGEKVNVDLDDPREK